MNDGDEAKRSLFGKTDENVNIAEIENSGDLS
jgi:hypothetical protein